MKPEITALQTSIDWLEFTVMEFSIDDVLAQFSNFPVLNSPFLIRGGSVTNANLNGVVVMFS